MNHKAQLEAEIKKFDYNNGKIRLTLGVLVVAVLCAFLIVVATFTELSFVENGLPPDAIIHPVKYLKQTGCSLWSFFISYKYIPQIPVIIFISALLGCQFGVLAVLIYIVAGLCSVPVFAMGGGWKYIFEYYFGYILAFIPAVAICGNILSHKLSFKNALKAAFFGVLLIHFIGIMYTAVAIIFRRNGFNFFMDMIAIQSGIKIIYDLVFSILAVIIARPVKRVLWLAMS